MKKLFKVHPAGVKHARYFDNKVEAKTHRDEVEDAVIMRGPDHWRGESFNRPERVGR